MKNKTCKLNLILSSLLHVFLRNCVSLISTSSICSVFSVHVHKFSFVTKRKLIPKMQMCIICYYPAVEFIEHAYLGCKRKSMSEGENMRVREILVEHSAHPLFEIRGLFCICIEHMVNLHLDLFR